MLWEITVIKPEQIFWYPAPEYLVDRAERLDGIWSLTYIFTFLEIVAVKLPPTFPAFRNNITCEMQNKLIH